MCENVTFLYCSNAKGAKDRRCFFTHTAHARSKTTRTWNDRYSTGIYLLLRGRASVCCPVVNTRHQESRMETESILLPAGNNNIKLDSRSSHSFENPMT